MAPESPPRRPRRDLKWYLKGAKKARGERRPHYPLRQIQAAFSTVRTLRITRTAVQCAERLGITLQGVVDVVAAMQPSQFYKSMTSDADNTIWQDVYHVPRGNIVLYVKLTVDAEGHLVISFKEK